MLKKIENIASASEFKNNTRFSGSVGHLPIITGSKSSSSDSLSFSSAFKYLSQLKWQLKSLTHSENDEFFLEVIIDNLLFSTKIAVHDCSALNIIYNISNETLLNPSSHKYQVVASFNFDSDVYSEPIGKSTIESVKRLFEKFVLYDSILSKNSDSPEVNSFFIEDDENNLSYELSLIHRHLIYFVEKVAGEVFSGGLKAMKTNYGSEKSFKLLQINVRL